MSKQYGLIIPSKKKLETKDLGRRVLKSLQTSDDELEKDDSDNDNKESLNWVEASLKASCGNFGQRSLQKRMLREAIEEDSTVFQYDEVYDSMKASDVNSKNNKKVEEKKPKYIDTILKHAEKRKLETERRKERKVQKERDAEGNEFADKEAFVTASYLKKLEELKEAEEAERREKYMEEQLDVEKHKNFGVFYNHLFKQRVGENLEIKKEPEDEQNESSGSPKRTGKSSDKSFQKTSTEARKKNYRTQRDLSESPERKPKIDHSRNYHNSNNSSDDEENVRYNKEPSRVRGRDVSKERSDDTFIMRKSRERSRERDREHSRERGTRGKFSKDRKRSRESSRERGIKREHSKDRKKSRERSLDRKKTREQSKERKRSREYSEEKDKNGDKKRKHKDKSQERDGKSTKNASEESSKSHTENKNDIKSMSIEDRIKNYEKIFAKRTVGNVFKDALQKYFQRRAERESNV